jgi:NAD-dependent dihydropyrimidine dehydrogenase PreA subunit
VGIPVLKRAKIRNLWPEKIDYPLLHPDEVRYKGFKLPSTAEHLITGKKTPKKSPIITDKCVGCGECEEICPKGAAKVDGDMARIDYLKCIRCFCCHEVCPENAIKLGIKKSYE